MAQLFLPGLRLSDANGNPLSGAKVRVYTANTTTLVSLYSDAALSSSITNPVITDSAGYPANGGNEVVINVAAGTYDVAFLDSDDNVLASWDDYSPSGETGDIERTVTGNGRIKITGSGGAVMIQAGDPSPDDTGGTLVIEGWAGTQLDSLTLDAATVNTTGRIKEAGKKIIGTVYTEATAFTAVSSVDIPLTEDIDGLRAWEVELFDLTHSTNGSLYARFSFDGGGTFKAGASDYEGQFSQMTAGSSTISNQAAAAQMVMHNGMIGDTNKPTRGKVFIITPDSGSNWTSLEGSFVGTNTTNLARHGPFYTSATGYGRATHIRFLPSAGTITGKYLVRPLRGYGET